MSRRSNGPGCATRAVTRRSIHPDEGKVIAMMPDSSADVLAVPCSVEDELVIALTQFAARRRRADPGPGMPGHDHWAGPRPAWLSRDIWRAYGDRYPGGQCRWLSENWPGYRPGANDDERDLAERAAMLWARVHGGAA
jgi:hypothetical protein